MGLELSRVYQLGQHADVYGKAGQAEERLRLLGQALAAVRNAEGRFSDAELSRLKGELMLACSAEPHAEGEACFRQALDIARRQQAKSLELRAAMSLARLWQQGKRQEAYDLLAPIYGWFTEGFDTADLQEAKALLETLAG
jgi:predicted ATPase